MDKRFKEILKIYRRLRNQSPDPCIAFTLTQTSLEEAIRVATLCLDRYLKKHSHQYRIPNNILKGWYEAVYAKAPEIKKIKSFDDLFVLLKSIRIKGIGDLTIYDTATRIGGYLKKMPDRIYLHAGTRVGAIKLVGQEKAQAEFLFKKDLPKIFQSKDLEYWELEDIFCIFKNCFSLAIDAITFKNACLKVC